MDDGILALFGLDTPAISGSINREERIVSIAINAGLEMIEAIAGLKPYFEAIHRKSFDIGLGLHYGEVIVGSVGLSAEKRRTVVGDAVNFASRIETANKNADTNFLMSEAAYLQVANEVEVNRCPPWEIRGKTGTYNLFEVVRAK